MGCTDASVVSVYVPFKYDLGGNIPDTDRLRATLHRLHGEPQVDAAVLRSWNLSYLAGHAPVLWCRLSEGTARLAGAEWSYSRRIRVFPWLGVASVDYTFTTTAATATSEAALDLTAFYDDLVAWKNADYIPYLDDCGALTSDLQLRLPRTSPTSARSDLHGTLIRDLRQAVSGLVEQRPFNYAFHDFRLCFIGPPDVILADRIWSLLWLTPSGTRASDEEIEYHRFADLDIASSGWSTVIVCDADSSQDQVDLILTLVNLIHAQWYICQLWINAHNLRGGTNSSEWQLADAHVLSANQLALAQDLSEIENLNVMLKDPGLLRVANFLEARMEVGKHRATAMSRLRVLENHSRQLADYKSEVELRRFQALFAISAAAGVASLVPALAQVGFSYIHTVTTVIPLFGLWGLFAIDFAVVKRWWKARRPSVEELESVTVNAGAPVEIPGEQGG